MNKLITEFDFHSATFTTRCGYPVKLHSWDNSSPYINGTVYVTLQNGIIFEHIMKWDKNGGSIRKGEFPTEYYYDLKYK